MKQEKKANIKAINDKISYWNQVAADLEAKRPTGLIAQAEEKAKENQQRLASMTAEEQQAAQQEVQKKIDAEAFERKEPRKKVRYVKEDADLGPSITPQEHVLREIATGRVSFSLSDTEGAQGLSSHLGYSNSPEERKKLVWALSSDGLTPEAAAEQIHADMPENLQGMVTDQDVFNMIINAFQEYGSPSKMWDAAKTCMEPISKKTFLGMKRIRNASLLNGKLLKTECRYLNGSHIQTISKKNLITCIHL